MPKFNTKRATHYRRLAWYLCEGKPCCQSGLTEFDQAFHRRKTSNNTAWKSRGHRFPRRKRLCRCLPPRQSQRHQRGGHQSLVCRVNL